jgi:hypothetical protein
LIDEILEEYERVLDKSPTGKPLKNLRHEIFAVQVACGMTQAASYRTAFNIEENVPVGSRPNTIINRPEVRARIGYLATQRAEFVINRSLLTERNILDEYAWGVRNSREKNKFKDHKGYLDSLARIFGLFAESKKKNEMADKSIEELRAEVKMLEDEFGIGGVQAAPAESGHSERDVTPPTGALPAVREAEGISQSEPGEEGAMLHGGESAGEDPLGGNGASDPRDG